MDGMSATMVDSRLDSDGLYGIAGQIWNAYLGADSSNPLVRIEDRGASEVVASISVTGSWDGHVVVGCSEAAATSIAAAMLDLDPDDVTDADILDAAGELVNVIGGNVKSLLPQPSLLSLPLTTKGDGRHVRYPGTREVCGLAARWRGELLTITVLQVDLS
jgi:chemotaxis protein CheX